MTKITADHLAVAPLSTYASRPPISLCRPGGLRASMALRVA